MILYTMVPEQLIFLENHTPSKQITVEINEGHLILEQVTDQQFRVVRLVSSDPNAYLNDNYAPGKMISLF